MIVQRRFLRRIAPLFGYVVALAATGYFAWSAWHGDRGLMAREHYEEQIAARSKLIGDLKTERERWQKRVSMLESEHIDKDLLEERALSVLNAGHANDVIVLLPETAKTAETSTQPEASE
jgi:cell division protein FtsB